MNSHSKAFEQYCCILKKNVVIVETAFHDGRKKLKCTMHPQCIKCRNKILSYNFEPQKTTDSVIDI